MQQFLQTNRQLGSPALTFQRDRLQREVQLQQQVVTSLAQQYEENRIREVRDTPVITVIEPPILAARPDARLRALILILGTAAGFCVALLTVVVHELWSREAGVAQDPAVGLLVTEWKRLRGTLDS